jgi:ATP-dependent protease Clp ATPase subunit
MVDPMFEMPSEVNAKSLRITKAFVEEKFQRTSIARLKVA